MTEYRVGSSPEYFKKKLPGLTHERTHKMGNKLTLTTERIYDKDSHYIDVAKHYKLLIIRRIRDGK